MFRTALSLVALLASPSALAEPEPPNVVLIISDDQAFTDFGFMGHAEIATPHLDRLADRSVFYTRAYVPTALCRPSLASMISGCYPQKHRITGNDPPKGTDRRELERFIGEVPCLPRLLAPHGYVSLQTGKWWEGAPSRGGFTQAMTHGDPKRGGRHGDIGLDIGRKTMEPIETFLDGREGKPFFLWYAPFLPHSPHNPPERLLERYQREGRSIHVARYMAMCTWFDETVGQLLAMLEARQLTNDTLVVFCVDNGWVQREDSPRYAEGSKRSVRELGVRTPMLFSWPGHLEPKTLDHLASTIDIAPTVLAACGFDVPDAMDGRNLMPTWTGEEPPREAVFGASFTHDIVAVGEPSQSLLRRWMIRGHEKLMEPTGGEGAWELYDLAADALELHDLAAERPGRVDALRHELDAWWKR